MVSQARLYGYNMISWRTALVDKRLCCTSLLVSQVELEVGSAQTQSDQGPFRSQ